MMIFQGNTTFSGLPQLLQTFSISCHKYWQRPPPERPGVISSFRDKRIVGHKVEFPAMESTSV